jgi:hypothetical protein
MKVLLDESLPRRLKRAFVGVSVRTVPEAGWAGLSNGDLLSAASPYFDVFVTADQNLVYQQNIAARDIGIIVLAAKSNRLSDLEPLVPTALERLAHVKKGTVIRIE